MEDAPSQRAKRRTSRCTDAPCLLLYLACLGAVGYVLTLALRPPSDLRRVIHGLDSQHDLCGVDNGADGEPRLVEMAVGRPSLLQRIWPFGVPTSPRNVTVLRGARDHSARPLLYFTLPTGSLGGAPAEAICVSACPNPTNGTSHDAPSEYVCTGQFYGTAADRRQQCADAVPDGAVGNRTGGGEASSAASREHGCAAPPADTLFSAVDSDELAKCDDPTQECTVCYPPYRTVQLLHYCLPDPQHALDTFSTVVTAFGAVGASTDGQLTLAELDEMRSFVASAPHLVWEDLVLSAPVIASCIGCAVGFGAVWMVLVRFFSQTMVWTTVIALSAGCGLGAYYMWITQKAMKASPRYASDELFTRQADILYYAFFGVASVGGLYTLLVLLLHRKIFVAVKVMKEASRAIGARPATLLLPVLTLTLSAVALGAFGLVALLLLSTCDLEPLEPGFGHLYVSPTTWGWLALVGMGALWTLCFVRHVQHCAISGALAGWYFDEAEGGGCLSALRRTLAHHAGSVAFGSLLITLLQVVRLLVALLLKRFRACAGDSSVAKLACCCATCCLGCVERSVRYLSRNAYIVMMVDGTSFCASAAEAIGLLTKHMVKVAIVRSIGAAFLLLGKLFITAGAAGVGAVFLLTQPPYDQELFSIVPAVVVIALGAWVVGTAFMSVYNVAVDTIFLCYALDIDRAKAGQRAGPDSLARLIAEHHQAEGPPDGHSTSAVKRAGGSSRRGMARSVSGRGVFVSNELSPGHLAEASSTRHATPAIEISDGAYHSRVGRARDMRV